MKTNSEVTGRFTHASHPPSLRFTYFNARPAAPHSLRLYIRSTSHTHIFCSTSTQLHTHSNPHPLSIKCIQPHILPTSAIRHHRHSPSDPFNFPWALHMSRLLIQPQAHTFTFPSTLHPSTSHPRRRGTWRHRRAFCVAGVALMALVWLWWPAWFPFGTVVAAAVCAAGVAFGDIDLHFLWQAWRLVTSTCALRQAWHLATSTFTLCGRRGAWRHRRAFCVAGVALMALVWLWWRVWFPFGTVVAAAVCVAGVALGDIDLHFLWQAWRLATSTCILWGRKNMQQNW